MQWVQSTWAGVAELTAPDLRHDYLLTGIKNTFGPAMAEYVICRMLMHTQRVNELGAAQRAQQWQPVAPASLAGATLAVLGLGSIGEHVALSARSLGMTVLGYRSSRVPHPAVDATYGPGQLHELLGLADFVVAVLPDTRETRGLIDAAALAAMNPGAVLINVGRAGCVDDAALIAELNKSDDTRRLAAAVLDVFDAEPLPPASPLWTTPGLTVTPHVAEPSQPEQISRIFADNYRRWLAGDPLKYVVDFDRGY